MRIRNLIIGSLLLVLALVLFRFGAGPVLPPLMAIALAIWTRHVLLSLFLGVFMGAFLHHGDLLTAFLRTTDHYILHPVLDAERAPILIFSMAIAGMVGVISRSGGTAGIVTILVRWAKSPRTGQLATWSMGLFIFFDDYANTLLVGNTMRPLTDRLKISREKLAFIVDCTAAPVASVALISTWIGFEVGLIQDAFDKVGYTAVQSYGAFLASIPYRFYGILTLIFVALVATLSRDFGPMLAAEQRARTTGEVTGKDARPIAAASIEAVKPRDEVPKRWFNAIIPVLTMIVLVFVGLYVTGDQALLQKEIAPLEAKFSKKAMDAYMPSVSKVELARREATVQKKLAAARPALEAEARATMAKYQLWDIIGKADSLKVLLWVSFFCSFLAMALPLLQGICHLGELIDAWVEGAKSLVLAMMILILAWGLNGVCTDLHTGRYLCDLVQVSGTGAQSLAFSPSFLPVIIFCLAAVVAFATGTSFGTMGILMILSVQLCSRMCTVAGLSPETMHSVLFGTIGAVLSGSVFGDHCSPISDTTIMSSMASGCDHIDHVRTQLPYAVLCAAVAALVGYLPAGFGWSPYVSLAVGIVILAAFLMAFGRPTDAGRDHFHTYFGLKGNDPS